ncbi:putative cis-zeatin O-glucosyltransferase [Iris pallida]|uniref:Cis-zeatin O-glucosyltransferase n=1 Tax=Iris pallida TaxID=29817 RepID=A0AAX6FG87_IRIPA|nr:putative cis-zeatin O-glucosyltransferase [Iris pallida]
MEQVTVVMVPFAAQGHLNQLLHFAINLSSTYVDLPVHYASSASYIRQAKSRVQGRDPASLEKLVHFHELPLPPFATPPPDPASNFPATSSPPTRPRWSCGPAGRSPPLPLRPVPPPSSRPRHHDDLRLLGRCLPAQRRDLPLPVRRLPPRLHSFCHRPDFDAGKLRRESSTSSSTPSRGA